MMMMVMRERAKQQTHADTKLSIAPYPLYWIYLYTYIPEVFGRSTR